LLALSLGFASQSLSSRAAAEEPPERQSPAAAEALFLDGRKLMAEGKIEEACQRFAESRRIEPAIGTTMNLARCYLKLGRTASAWLLYRDTAATARELGQADREQHARKELAAIEPDLAKLVVEAEPALLGDARVEVMLDGSRIPNSMLGAELPLDPGSHQLAVRTPRSELWSEQVQALPRHTERLSIPHLDLPREPVESAPAAASAPPTVSASSGGPKDVAAKPTPLSARRKVALGFAGVAVVTAGYAVLETFEAISANESSNPASCKRGTTCDDSAIKSRERAFDSARRANVAAGISGVCLLGAGILWVLGAPPDQPISAQAGASAWLLNYRRTW